ncbi:MAG: DNA polymerase I, partial [Thermoanaerobaculia bacterium]|nr:DNA polymerase I [Thermoanaerobaculia bacterium]
MSQTTSERPRVFLIDGYSNIFRAYYAIRDLSSSKGEPTNAVFGFLNMLRKLLRDEAPKYLGVAFDVSSDTHRRDQFADYKANRAPMPEDLRPQVPWIRKLLEAYKIPILEQHKYEADDVLGTLARKAVAAGFDVVLLSPDKDLMQLVDEHVFVYHTRREKLYDAKEVEAEWGVPPARVADVLALMGDSSDNVPGVPGIGRKGAEQLVREYGSVEQLLERAGEISRKAYREGLQEHREQALQSKELVTIHTEVPVEFEPEQLVLDEPDWPALLELCRELDFTSLVKEIEAQHAAPAEPVAETEVVTTAAVWR